MNNNNIIWSPKQEWLLQFITLFRQSLSGDNAVQQVVYKQLQNLKEYPEYACYLTYILINNKDESALIRQTIGATLRAHISDNWIDINLDLKEFIKSTIIHGIGDTVIQVRRSVASVVATICTCDGLQSWPGILNNLVQSLDNNDENLRHGCLLTLSHLCEDIPNILVEYPDNPLNVMIPKFIQLMLCNEETYRILALNSINQFLTYFPIALQDYLSQYLMALFQLTHDQSNQVRKRICQAFVLLIRLRPISLHEHMNNVIQFMINANQDVDYEICLEACEFWIACSESETFDMNILQNYLPHLIPVLLKSTIYTELDLASIDDGDDMDLEDHIKDIAPRFHTPKSAFDYNDNDDDDDDDDNNNDEEDWNDNRNWSLRKCAAAALDILSNKFGNNLLIVYLPELEKCLQNNNDWKIRESGILSLGAIAEGCFEGITEHLPNLIPFLINLMKDLHALIRSICCWTLSRYFNWIILDNNDEKYLKPLLIELLQRLLDRNKKVQQAACSAFAVLEESAGDRLLPYLDAILNNLMFAFQKYKAKNLPLLYDTISTLAETMGDILGEEKYMQILMPPLLNKWNEVDDHDRQIFSLFECFSFVAQATGESFLPYSLTVYKRCMDIINKQIRIQDHDYEFIVCCLDLISGVCEGIGPRIEELITSSNDIDNFINILGLCTVHNESEVRTSAFALIGDIAKFAINIIRSHIPNIIPICAQNITSNDDDHYNCCNNASWAVGEIAMQYGNDMHQFIPILLEPLAKIMTNENLPRPLLENNAITIGRLALVCPNDVAAYLPIFAGRFCSHLVTLKDGNEEKNHAYTGLCLSVSKNPTAMLPCFNIFCLSIASWINPSNELKNMFYTVLQNYKTLCGDQWEVHLSKCPPEVVGKLRNLYSI